MLSGNAGIANNRESQDTGIAISVAIGGKLSRTVLANSVTRPKKVTLLRDPYRRPYLRRSSAHTRTQATGRVLWDFCGTTVRGQKESGFF